MTDPPFARTFKRFALGAVLGLALAGLAACGGGGSSTPAKTTPTAPEISITPSAPTPEELASAIDVTGQDTFEGRLDSDNRRTFYKIRIDEATGLVLRSEDDIDITVYDSEGDVVNPSTAEQLAAALGAASAGGGHAEVSNVEEALPYEHLGLHEAASGAASYLRHRESAVTDVMDGGGDTNHLSAALTDKTDAGGLLLELER